MVYRLGRVLALVLVVVLVSLVWAQPPYGSGSGTTQPPPDPGAGDNAPTTPTQPTPPQSPTVPVPNASIPGPLQEDLLAASNVARTAEGLSRLQANPGLAAAAQLHAEDMAELGYFSHQSPRPDRATLGQRVAYVGAPQAVIAENLALIAPSDDIAGNAISGWLASPGHRANLMNPLYDQVGFGFATSERGEVYIVQVLAFEPRTLIEYGIESADRTFYRLEVAIQSSQPVEALISLGKTEPFSVMLPAGESIVDLTTDEPGLQQLRIGVEVQAGAGFVIDAATWIEAATGSLQPDPTAPRSYVRIARVASRQVTEPVTTVRLRYEDGIRPLAVFLDGQYLSDAEVAPGLLEFPVRTDGLSSVSVGIVDGNTASFFHRFTVIPSADGRVTLVTGAVEPAESP